MDSDKITVDEPLISTDVDSLIRTIAERRKISLKELRRLCDIDKKNLDKWIAVLEDEGYISIEYGIRGTFINWSGGEVAEEEEEYVREEPQEVPYQRYEEYRPVGEDPEPEEEPEPEVPSSEPEDDTRENIFTQELPLEEDDSPAEQPAEPEEEPEDEPDPEELLDQYLAKKRGGEEPSIDELKSKILTSLEEEVEALDEQEAEEEPEPQEDERELDFSKLDDVTSEPEEPEEEPEEVREVTLRPTVREETTASDIRALMSSYMQEINQEKAAIHMLRKEKENLYRDKFTSLEGRMQADLVALTERIIEKQTKLAELREHVLELPDKVDEVSRIQAQMDRLKDESEAALQRTRDKAETFISSVEASKEDVRDRIAELNSSVEAQSSKLAELEEINSSLEERSSKLKESMEEARAQVVELNSAMASLAGDLSRVQEAREEIETMKDSLKDTVASHGEELESLQDELEEIAKVESWVAEYVRDYEAKITDIENYVTNSDEELASLKESSESLYMKKYLGELENLTDAYESGLEDAISTEKDIDEKIASSKSRITELVRESKEMMRKLHGDVSKSDDYDSVLTNVRKKTSRVSSVVREKKQEREKLTEDSKKARKTRRTAATRKAGEKAKAKKKTKQKKRK